MSGLFGRPVVRAAVASGALMATGDVFCQMGGWSASDPEDASEARPHDWARTARFGLVGLTLHGPFFYHGFRWIDGLSFLNRSSPIASAVAKSLAVQVALFPTYTTAFSGYMGTLEGFQGRELLSKVSAFLAPTLFTGCAFWPVVNTFNFALVAPPARCYYVALMGLIWNTYLSYSNARATQQAPALAAAPEARGGSPGLGRAVPASAAVAAHSARDRPAPATAM
ncbi:unnamed protein product [Pedinophyceae sp. YPF-701]|nr:unnamed protein product [Pedinophyceae sp. YPF-701]